MKDNSIISKAGHDLLGTQRGNDAKRDIPELMVDDDSTPDDGPTPHPAYTVNEQTHEIQFVKGNGQVVTRKFTRDEKGNIILLEKQHHDYTNPATGQRIVEVNTTMQSKLAEKRNTDGIRTKDNFDGPRVENKHEDVCPPNESICPCTKERDARPIRPLAPTASVNPVNITDEQKEVLNTPITTKMSSNAKEDMITKTAMYDAVYMMPGKSQWCPKLRTAVSMHTCAFVCPEGRRIPQVKTAETYTDYLINGGSDDGEVKCGLKMWMETEMDRYKPGWVEEHIQKMGGEVAGSETNFGNRKMNLDPKERRHLPRYPEEKLVEKQLEERHHFSEPETKLASTNAKRIMSAGVSQKKNGVGYNGLDKEAFPNPLPPIARKVREVKTKLFPAPTPEQKNIDTMREIHEQLQRVDSDTQGNPTAHRFPHIRSFDLTGLLTKAQNVGIEPKPANGVAGINNLHSALESLRKIIGYAGMDVDVTKLEDAKVLLSQALGIAQSLFNKSIQP